jgi:NDP-sugar pyrophosphorylase family protein
MLTVAILAGGLGTRLRPKTESVPKALLDISGRPFIAHQLELLQQSGVRRAVLCVGYLGDMIRDCIGDGRRFGLEVDYSFDGPSLRGTAGAISHALPLLEDRFFVLYGDSYLPCDFRAVEHAFLSSSRPALMTVFRNCDRWEPSNVDFHDGSVAAYDKHAPKSGMEHIDYGLSAFCSSVFCGGSGGDLSATFRILIERGLLAGFEVKERFYEVGSWEGIRALRQYLRLSRPRTLQV